mmetsp:Transcript_17538/g.51580  ORF Transcript_17538/g.51580 Transcript_17538/m.51580 type:complete len:553 (-) Transcript_17538:93-1751(-)
MLSTSRIAFRDPLAVVRTSEGGWRLTATYASIALAAVHVGTGVDIMQTVAGWLSANNKVLQRLDGAVDQLQLQLKTLQESVDSISGFLLHSLEEQDVTLTIRELRSVMNALMRSAALPGEVVNFERLRVAQHKLLDLGPAIWGARDARSKHGPKMVDLLITSYSVEIGLLRNHKPGQVQARREQIDQEVRSTFPAIEAAIRSGSFFREQCPALDCLLPQLLVGPPLRIPSDDGEPSASQQLVELQGNAVAEALAGGRPVAEAEVKAALGCSLLQGGAYHSSRAKRFLDLARASYCRAATYDGRSWQIINVSGAESSFNLRVIGKALSDIERKSVDPPPPFDAAVAIEVCFRGSVFTGEEGGVNLDNWLSINLNPGVAKSKDGWLPELTPIDGQIGEASQLKGVHVHAGFQNAYLAARGPVLKWLNEQREHPDQRLHISCCGHSLGAALATLLAFDLGFMGRDSVELVTWASPRVGDKAFCDAFAKHVPDVARFTCGADVVPRMPPEALGFEHVCPEMRLDAWVTSAKSVITREIHSLHGIEAHAINLENCFS